MLSNGNFFLTGGELNREACNIAWEINGEAYTVKEHSPMIESRMAHAICNFKDVIYVFGGFDYGS